MLAKYVIEVVRKLQLSVLVVDGQIVALAETIVKGAADSQVLKHSIRDRHLRRCAVGMALPDLVRNGNAEFIHFSAKDGVEGENSAAPLVDKVFRIVERLGNFILSLRPAEPIGVVVREIGSEAEMVGG